MGMRQFSTVLVVLAVVLAASAACRFSPDQLPTPTEVGFFPLTEVAAITPPSPERRACQVPAGSPAVPELADPLAAAPQLQTYLNDGGDPLELAAADPNLALWRPDLDGDGLVDLAFTLTDPSGPPPQGSGQLFVYHCRGDRYILSYASQPSPELGPPMVQAADDLNGDGSQDLLVEQDECGAHTCTAQVRVLVWNDGTLVNRLEGQTDDLPSPQIDVQANAAGFTEIAITAQGVASAGAGPFRPITRVWSWDEAAGVFRVASEQPHETTFRIHHLQDADAAALDGQLATAEAAYLRVINDDSLRGWVDPERERRVLAGYAQFRLVTTAVQAGDRARAQERYEQLQDQYAGDPVAGGYAELGQAFWQAFQAEGDLAAGCQAAQAFAAAHAPSVLDPLYFGYANPTYSAIDICPLPAP
jgi:hypothetical protein